MVVVPEWPSEPLRRIPIDPNEPIPIMVMELPPDQPTKPRAAATKKRQPTKLKRPAAKPKPAPKKRGRKPKQQVLRGKCTWCGHYTPSIDQTIHPECLETKQRVKRYEAR